jgi:hypothetical protein
MAWTGYRRLGALKLNTAVFQNFSSRASQRRPPGKPKRIRQKILLTQHAIYINILRYLDKGVIFWSRLGSLSTGLLGKTLEFRLVFCLGPCSRRQKIAGLPLWKRPPTAVFGRPRTLGVPLKDLPKKMDRLRQPEGEIEK